MLSILLVAGMLSMVPAFASISGIEVTWGCTSVQVTSPTKMSKVFVAQGDAPGYAAKTAIVTE